jgi:ketosteroid isomerase-like protein
MTTDDVLSHHLEAFNNQDMEENLADYGEESVVLLPGGEEHRGLDAIEALFAGFFEEFGKDGAEFVLDDRTTEGDLAFIVWHAETPDNTYEHVSDTFLIRDGIIEVQWVAPKATPKN